MRRRYLGGMPLGKPEFYAQPWAEGMLLMETIRSRERLGLWKHGPGYAIPPEGILWRPVLAACFNDSISFAGFERVENRWCYQVWYCETRSS